MRPINTIIIHCSDSPNGRPNTVEDVDAWHKEKGFRRLMRWRLRQNYRLAHVGYHYVIGVDGKVWSGRHLDEIGAHAKGHNADSVGICLVGRDAFTPAQWSALYTLVQALPLTAQGHDARIIGHREVEPRKTCPGFDVRAWIDGGRIALSGHVLTA